MKVESIVSDDGPDTCFKLIQAMHRERIALNAHLVGAMLTGHHEYDRSVERVAAGSAQQDQGNSLDLIKAVRKGNALENTTIGFDLTRGISQAAAAGSRTSRALRKALDEMLRDIREDLAAEFARVGRRSRRPD